MTKKAAGNTRIDQMENGLKESDEQIQQLQSQYVEVHQDLHSIHGTMADLVQKMADLTAGMQTLIADRDRPKEPPPTAASSSRQAALASGILGASPDPPSPGNIIPRPPTFNTITNDTANQGFLKVPKLDFPPFDGANVRGWLLKANRYFQIYPLPDNQKILCASLYFRNKAESWFQAHSNDIDKLNWFGFSELVRNRFSTEVFDNITAEFNRLCQITTVEDYQARFEELQPLVLQRNQGLTEQYFIDSFIGGLKEELRHVVQMFRPTSLTQAINLAKLQEATLAAAPKPLRQFTKPTSLNPSTVYNKTYNSTPSSYSPYTKSVGLNTSLTPKPITDNTPTSNSIPIKKLSQQEMHQRREKGLCYTCDEKYSFDHKCKNKQLFCIISPDDDDTTSLLPDTAVPEQPYTADTVHSPSSEVGISLNALSGTTSFQTLRLQGKVNSHVITMLVDSGSTHNFLDTATAQLLGCAISDMPSHSITVAGGGQLSCNSICRGFQWSIQGALFESDVRILPLGGCDLVLGVQWLKAIGPVLMDFSLLQLQFTYKGKSLSLKGFSSPNNLQVMSMQALHKYTVHNTMSIMGVLFSVSDQEPSRIILPPVQQVLNDFASVFDEPNSVPPPRSQDHSIVLKDGATPMSIRPYRYPHIQKEEIEKQIQEMLSKGIIQPSHSPFSSPVILVKKKDNTWRFCIDYRHLNSLTVKQPFPIPIIEELLDELHGAAVFSKLDLRAGYHQIRVKADDIAKTAFSTHSGHYEFRVMPFGLTNAPATFQGLMNEIFAPYLRRFILVFFDDILVYSHSLEEHLLHLRQTFQILQAHQLHVKLSKCQFGQTELEYLGHTISVRGVSADPVKIDAIRQWPTPKTVKALRGFLGLTGYYRRFIKNYGMLAQPLTRLLKKDQFCWTPATTQAFQLLQTALIHIPTLGLPDFTKPFEVETDACQSGVGAVLLQDRRPLAFLSKVLPPSKVGLSTYEKELWAIIYAVQKWRYYLYGRHFIINTDHQSLKFLLEQRITTILQQKWLAKLLGYDYEIRYKKGSLNIPADSLSRAHEDSKCDSMTVIQPAWLTEVSLSWEGDDKTQAIITQLLIKADAVPDYTWDTHLLRHKGKIVIGSSGQLRHQIWQELHASPTGGHSGIQATVKRISHYFFWPSMISDVRTWNAQCTVCQANKSEHVASPGLLQPLPTPDKPWTDISMDFIEGLPSSGNKNTILVIVDRFSKYSHFVALKHPFTASTVAQLYLDSVFKLHGLPQKIISDRGSVFLSQFWRKLFELVGTKLLYSSSYHPQTDGQTERVNQCLETYLRCMASLAPNRWATWLPLAEWWYNTSHHTATKLSPFQALYGYIPPFHTFPQQPATNNVEVHKFLTERAATFDIIKDNLLFAKARMKFYADKRRTERVFKVGDYVYLRLQPYRQHSVSVRRNLKLAPRFFGPYKITEKIGTVAYRLELPDSSLIHPIFHVSQLKQAVGVTTPISTSLPPTTSAGQILLQPVSILDHRTIKRRHILVPQLLIQWSHHHPADTTWEDEADFLKRFPHLRP
ncbi:hypothetical protein ACHQM5_004534 [Ranunculus cassubicifolius]